jgi:hypothetical protein
VQNYKLTSGVLQYKNKIYIGVNTELRAKLMQSMHTSELGGHSGEKTTYQRIKLLFAWPGLIVVVTGFVKVFPNMDFIRGLPNINLFHYLTLLGHTLVWISLGAYRKQGHHLSTPISYL